MYYGQYSNNLTFGANYQTQLKKTYDALWKELELPANLKPQLQYRSIFCEMLFDFNDYAIVVNKNISEKEMKCRNKSGENKALLRHEIEHVKQMWEIIRLKGAKKTAEIFVIDSNRFAKKSRKVEKTLGKLNPNTQQGQIAKKYYNALIDYTDCNKNYSFISIQEIIDLYKYSKNILEKNARKEAKKYEPQSTFVKFINYIKNILKNGENLV